MLSVAAFACGLIFGIGLLISGMAQPAKVLNFLDLAGVASGTWDPSLAFVMAAALAVSGAGYALAGKRTQPMLAPGHLWPTRRDIDRPLIAGAVLFGIGWGLVGLCPGPALVDLATLMPQVIVFVAVMIGGMLLHDFWWAKRTAAGASAPVDG
ncbi:MAG: YeeE/YedE family protein [Alphaproteobacteria bacterium]|nr:YeeE/YedE family protein [Alphaproteobacteria bacterium]